MLVGTRKQKTLYVLVSSWIVAPVTYCAQETSCKALFFAGSTAYLQIASYHSLTGARGTSSINGAALSVTQVPFLTPPTSSKLAKHQRLTADVPATSNRLHLPAAIVQPANGSVQCSSHSLNSRHCLIIGDGEAMAVFCFHTISICVREKFPI